MDSTRTCDFVLVCGGFGLENSTVEFFHTPIWVIGGCIGTWLFAVFVCWVLVRFVFKDFDLEDGEEK